MTDPNLARQPSYGGRDTSFRWTDPAHGNHQSPAISPLLVDLRVFIQHNFFSWSISRNRFLEIRRFFHLSNNTALNLNNNCLHKLSSFLSLVIPKFQELYTPKRDISQDKSMNRFKGRLGIVQYMPKKP